MKNISEFIRKNVGLSKVVKGDLSIETRNHVWDSMAVFISKIDNHTITRSIIYRDFICLPIRRQVSNDIMSK